MPKLRQDFPVFTVKPDVHHIERDIDRIKNTVCAMLCAEPMNRFTIVANALQRADLLGREVKWTEVSNWAMSRLKYNKAVDKEMRQQRRIKTMDYSPSAFNQAMTAAAWV